MSHRSRTRIGRWSDGPGPLHRKLSDALRAAVAPGMLPAGERLPSERDLATRLAVSRSTVVAAYDTLRGEGLLESRQGSGTRVRPAAPAAATRARRPISPVYRSLIDDRGDVISLACAIFPSHPLVAEAVAEVVAAEDAEKLLAHNGYLPAGLPALREALADMADRRGHARPTPEQVAGHHRRAAGGEPGHPAARAARRRRGGRGAQLQRHDRRVPRPRRPPGAGAGRRPGRRRAGRRPRRSAGAPAGDLPDADVPQPDRGAAGRPPAPGAGRAGGRARASRSSRTTRSRTRRSTTSASRRSPPSPRPTPRSSPPAR